MESPYLRESVCPSPVGLVLTERDGRPNAMTASFFSEVAHHPTTLWVSIARASFTHELIAGSGRFSLVILHKGQGELAVRCAAASGRDVDKAAGLDVYRVGDGHWYLNDAMVSVACRVRSARAVGDHTLFIADILAGECETRNMGRRHLLTADLR